MTMSMDENPTAVGRTTVFAAALVMLLLLVAFTACDVRSGTAKREMEKYTSTPTVVVSPTPEGTPIDPADVVTADTLIERGSLSIDGDKQNKTLTCTKLDRVMVNGDNSVVTLKGACGQLMINGDRNKVTSDAVMELVLNGTENNVTYMRFVNGKRPSILENQGGNLIEKAPYTTHAR